MTQLHRYLNESGFDSFRVAAIEKVTTGITTVQEVLRVLPYSAMRRKYLEESRSGHDETRSSYIKLINAT
jgi:hypothetical protein